ncbi:hypothetical protein GCM10009788_03980 [Nocardioides humi]|uniref:SGNH hydrolase-type esterase domain-containing protein n=1 Tax=Nocardioides humi TaxID=449461 RepID=A0ABN1ZT45_9ACTN
MRVQRQLSKIRRLRSRMIDVPLQQVEQARRRLATEDVDVLLLGDSSTLCWSLRDTDRTLLPAMLGQRLGNVVTLAGPGFGSSIYAEATRLLTAMDRRPKAVVFTLALRTTTATHIVADPITGYHRSLAAMAKVPGAHRRIRYVGRGGSFATDEERDAFLAQPVESRWNGARTIGWYRQQLVGTGLPPWPIELEKLRFDYFYGEQLHADDPRLDSLTSLGRRLEEYGVPTVGVWTRPPMQRGEMHFPGEFEAHVRSHKVLQDEALARGCADLGPMLDIDLEDEDFEDSFNATEHFAHSGRVKVADAIAEAVRAR